MISAVKRDPTKVLKQVSENVLESNNADPCQNFLGETIFYIAKEVKQCRRC